jgi:hypothetical protein
VWYLSLQEVRERIGKYREPARGADDDPCIGCVILVEPFFFAEPDWIRKTALQWKPFAIGAARLAALGYFTVTGCIPQAWLASAGPRGYRRNQSKYQFATDRS